MHSDCGVLAYTYANSFYQKMRKSLGSKRNELSAEHIKTITQLYSEFNGSEYSKIYDNHHFGYTTVTVERPLRMTYSINEENIIKLQQEKAFMKLEQNLQHLIIAKLNELCNPELIATSIKQMNLSNFTTFINFNSRPRYTYVS